VPDRCAAPVIDFVLIDTSREELDGCRASYVSEAPPLMSTVDSGTLLFSTSRRIAAAPRPWSVPVWNSAFEPSVAVVTELGRHLLCLKGCVHLLLTDRQTMLGAWAFRLR